MPHRSPSKFFLLHSAFCVLLFSTACTPATPPPSVAPPRAQAQPPQPFTPAATAQRVVLMSLDGLGADALAQHTDLGAFARLADGTHVKRIIPSNPTVTASAHVSILTGTTADRHGIVSNRFHAPGTPREQATQGMDAAIDVETLVEAAKRQGKRVGCLPFPTCDATSPRRTADFGMVWAQPLTRGRLIRIPRADFKAEWVPPTWTPRELRRRSFSPVLRSRIEWSVPDVTRSDVDVVLYDTTDDRVQNYDLLFIEQGGEEIVPGPKGWFPLTRRTNVLYGSWSKITRFDAQGVSIYWGAVHRTVAYPDELQSMLDTQAGFWPGAPDENLASDALAGREGIDPQTFIEQLERFSEFLTKSQQLVIQRVPFDLLLAYQPQIDEATHQFYITTGPNVEEGNRVRRAAFVAADRGLATLMHALDPARDALVVTGDHGLAPIDTEARVNRLLSERQLTNWTAYASGNVAQLYRFGGEDNTDAVIAMLNATGLFEQVERRSPTAHRNTGDVLAIAKPNVALSSSDRTPAVGTPGYFGQHGGLNTHPEFHTVLFAWGAGVRREIIDELPQTRIARYVSTLMGMHPPAAAQ
ncbi:MAG TPA: alkaline phosphatase family protein [Thermoanaerobaculia bacterium]|jgi:predicted AlkP superfamily pyrophosphatase or phosphodiesterase